MENVDLAQTEKVYPCDYCCNPMHGEQGCKDLCCLGYSRFIPDGTTPKSVFDYVEKLREKYHI